MTTTQHQEDERRPGIGVDARGGEVIDPTKNVRELVLAESKYQDGMRDSLEKQQNFARDAHEKFQNFARESESRLQTWMRDAESKRTDQIRSQAERFETIISNMLSKSVESTQSLVATQLLQIQNTFNERVARLEQWRYERTGSASVSDPALASSLSGLGSGLSGMQASFADALTRMTNNQTEAMNKMAANIVALQETDTKSASRSGGQADTMARLGIVLVFLVSLVGPVITIMALRGK